MAKVVLTPLVAALLVAGCTGTTGAPGPNGDAVEGTPGDKGEPGDAAQASISSISPARVFASRTVDLLISGSGTNWSEDAEVLFPANDADDDPAIVVHETRRASPTAIEVVVELTGDVALGARDVMVRDGDLTHRLAGALVVESAIQVLGGWDATQFQGSTLFSPIRMRDTSTPFNPRSTRSAVGDGSAGHVNPFLPYIADCFLVVDVKATPGRQNLRIESGLDDAMVVTEAPRAVNVKPRLPQDLANVVTTVHADDYVNKLFSFDAKPGQAVLLTIRPQGLIDFEAFVIPTSGRFDEGVDHLVHFGFDPDVAGAFYAPTAGTYYLVLRPFGELPDLDIEVHVETQTPVVTPITTPDPIFRDAISGSQMEVFTVTALAGQRITAAVGPGMTSGCGPFEGINANVQILDADGIPVATYNHTIEPDNFCPNASGVAPADGTYYVRVSPHTRSFPLFASGADYPCLPAPHPECMFDYSLTVEVK